MSDCIHCSCYAEGIICCYCGEHPTANAMRDLQARYDALREKLEETRAWALERENAVLDYANGQRIAVARYDALQAKVSEAVGEMTSWLSMKPYVQDVQGARNHVQRMLAILSDTSQPTKEH